MGVQTRKRDTKREKKREQKKRQNRKEVNRTISLKTNTGEIREFPLIKLTKKVGYY